MKETEHKLQSYKTLIQWFWKISKGFRLQALLNLLIGLILVCISLLFVVATKNTVDIATHSSQEKNLYLSIAILASLTLAQIVLSFTSRWVRVLLGIRSQNQLQRNIFHRLLTAEWSSLKAFHTGDLLNRLEIDASGVVGFITESIPSLVTTLFQLIGAFVLLFSMNKTLALAVLFIGPFFLLASKLFIRKLRTLSRSIREQESNIQSMLQESLQHTIIIKTLQRNCSVVGQLSEKQLSLQDKIKHRTKYSSISNAVLNLGFSAGYLFAFSWGVINLQKGLITYGSLLAFVQLVGQIQGPIRSLTRFVPIIIGAATAAERLIEISDISQEESQENNYLKEPIGISIKNVTYSYEKEGKNILKDFSYEIKAGDKIGILGKTGVGKTTLIRLVLSLIAPTNGDIFLIDQNGYPHKNNATLRCNISYVPQGNTLLQGTIRTNLLLGNENASENRLWEVLEEVNAQYVKQLPKGLDTPCGELGSGLSEGQAQRICIARALLHNSPILILDESTSALDVDTEKNILSSITSKYANKTILFITHRPAALSFCNKQLRL